MAGGRQREFNKEEALKEAMHVFWKKGYVGASLADLTCGMGINKPSMYAAFGNKEQLFIQATEYYLNYHASVHFEHLQAPDLSLQDRLKGFMLSTVAGQCDLNSPKGCYISLCVSEAASESIPGAAEEAIAKAKNSSEMQLTEFFAEEQQKGHLSADTDCTHLALLIMTVLHGTAALARGGKTLQELQPLIDSVLTIVDTMA